MNPFTMDLERVRADARSGVEDGPITDTYGADRTKVIEVLNAALATEIVCVLRYRRHYTMADGMTSLPIAAEFLEHAVEEQGHADLLAHRIVELGGEPDYNPATLVSRSHAEYSEGRDLADMVEQDLIAERIAISTYQEIVRWLGDDDPTTRRLIEEILAVEEEHAADLASLRPEVASPRGGVRPSPSESNAELAGRASDLASPGTLYAERADAAAPHTADRPPTSEEARLAEEGAVWVDERDVALHEREMTKLGATVKGEGEIA
jgi:bacterioferritin